MRTLILSKDQYPNLSQWDKERVYKAVLSLTKRANPNKADKDITNVDLYHSAKMLEMDLQNQFNQ